MGRPIAALALALFAGCAPPGAAAERTAAITDGTEDRVHLQVGYIEKEDGSIGCSATLVGPRSVITAGHCVWPDHTQVVVLDGARYRSERSVIQPAYDPTTHAEDIGLLTLERVAHLAPGQLSGQPAATGTALTLVGYGATADSAEDQGVRRQATNVVSDLGVSFFAFAGTGGGSGNVCHKDSGGAALVTMPSGLEAQAGVVIGGDAPCGTRGFATRVDLNLAWLKKERGGDVAVAGEPGAFGHPCAADADCKTGICRGNLCTAACSGARDCTGGAPCQGGYCALPDPPRDDGGCSLSRGPGSGASPLLVFLLVALGLRRRTSRGRCAGAPWIGASPRP